MNLYPEMNEKISKLLRMSEEPAQMYAADLIDAYRKSGLEPDEITSLFESYKKSNLEQAEELYRLQQEIPHWIPVGEQFPKAKDEQYAAFLVPSLFNENVYGVRAARYFGESGWTDKTIVRAKYYMPLPPKEEA